MLSAPARDGTGCEFDSWQCRIYIPCSLSLRFLGSLRGSLVYIWLKTKIVLKKQTMVNNGQNCYCNPGRMVMFSVGCSHVYNLCKRGECDGTVDGVCDGCHMQARTQDFLTGGTKF